MNKRTPTPWLAVIAAMVCVLQPCIAPAAEGGILWRIGQDGYEVGYLLGTVHSDDERLLAFSDEFEAALKSCNTFAMELVPDQPTLTRLLEFMQYPDDTKLVDQIGEERYARLLEAVSGYGLGEQQLARMKVWAAMMTVSIPPPRNGLFMDFALALQAAGSGLRVAGLETLEEQLDFLEQMPEDHQLAMLDQALKDFDQMHQAYSDLIDSYLSLDLDSLLKESRVQMADLPEEVNAYFESQGIVARNARMVERLEAELRQGKVFAAVGALHLPGESGLIALLEDRGYTLAPVEFRPFEGTPGR